MTFLQTNINERDYQALRSGAALQVRPAHGLLKLSDADRVDFVQRMTTNDVARLQPGQVTVTVMTSSIARIQYVFSVLQRGEDLLLLPAGEEVEQLARHLRSQIFFMDKVTVENLSGHVRRMRLMGPEAAAVLQSASLPAPEDGNFAEQDEVIVLRQARFDVPGYELIVPGAQAEDVREALVAAGAVLLADDEAYEVRRVELGRPGVGHEIVEDFTPLEVGLAWTCAENKGCYTGQEIIARQITYDKVTKTLVGLRSDDLLPEGADINADGRPAGTVTSSVYSPTLDVPMALAVVKRPHNEPGSTVEVGENPVTVVTLPFISEE